MGKVQLLSKWSYDPASRSTTVGTYPLSCRGNPAVTLLLLLFNVIGPVSAGSVSGGTVALLSWRWNRLLLMVVAFSSPYEDLRGGLCPRAYLHVVGMLRFMFLYKPTECAHSFLFCSSVYFFLYDPFNWVSFHKFSRQFAALSLCSSGLLSALSVLSTVYLFVKISFSPFCGWLGLKHQLTKLDDSFPASAFYLFLMCR